MARILVVDDEPDQRALLRRIFERAGHEVWDAGNGAAALEVVRESVPDLVVTDMMMPVMGGPELMMELTPLVNRPDWNEAWLQYCRYLQAPANEQIGRAHV